MANDGFRMRARTDGLASLSSPGFCVDSTESVGFHDSPPTPCPLFHRRVCSRPISPYATYRPHTSGHLKNNVALFQRCGSPVNAPKFPLYSNDSQSFTIAHPTAVLPWHGVSSYSNALEEHHLSSIRPIIKSQSENAIGFLPYQRCFSKRTGMNRPKTASSPKWKNREAFCRNKKYPPIPMPLSKRTTTARKSERNPMSNQFIGGKFSEESLTDVISDRQVRRQWFRVVDGERQRMAKGSKLRASNSSISPTSPIRSTRTHQTMGAN